MYEDLLEKQKKQQQKIDDFSELLDSLSSATDKKKLLWKEIYENALHDRLNASVLFTEGVYGYANRRYRTRNNRPCFNKVS